FSARLLYSALQMKRKEVVDAVPGVQQNMRTGKIVKFTGIHHVGKQFAFALLEGFVNEPYGLEIRHVYVERTLTERTSLHSLHRRSAILSSRDIFHYHSGNVKSWSWRSRDKIASLPTRTMLFFRVGGCIAGDQAAPRLNVGYSKPH